MAEKANERGVEIFCLTDHDTLAGGDESCRYFQGKTALRGVELSCKEAGQNIHLLLYGLQKESDRTTLSEKLSELQQEREKRFFRILERLESLGISIDPEPYYERAKTKVLGRPDVADALVKQGVCTSFREAFTRFLRDGGPADVESKKLSLKEGLALGQSVGAKMSMAHPHVIDKVDIVEAFYQEYKDEGLEGIEAWYGPYGKKQRKVWLCIAEKYDLIVTGGSDFHGAATPDIARVGIEVPDLYTDKLLKWLKL